MNKKQWIILLSGLVVLALAVWGITHFTKTKDTANEAQNEAEKEVSKTRDEKAEEISEKVGIKEKLVSMEEIEKAIKGWEVNEGTMTPTKEYEYIKEEFGKENAEAFKHNQLYKEDDSEFVKDQIVLMYQNRSEDTKTVPLLPLLEIERSIAGEYGGDSNKVDSYTIVDEVGKENEVYDDNYYLDKLGFEKAGNYLIGYPKIDTTYKHDNYYWDELFDTDKDEYTSKSTLTFYVLLEEDMKLEDAIEELSNLDVQVQGNKADYFGKVLEKDFPELKYNHLKSLIDLNVEDGMEYLPKNGVVTVMYEYDGENIFPKGTENEIESYEDIESILNNPEFQPRITINGKEFQLQRGSEVGIIQFQK